VKSGPNPKGPPLTLIIRFPQHQILIKGPPLPLIIRFPQHVLSVCRIMKLQCLEGVYLIIWLSFSKVILWIDHFLILPAENIGKSWNLGQILRVSDSRNMYCLRTVYWNFNAQRVFIDYLIVIYQGYLMTWPFYAITCANTKKSWNLGQIQRVPTWHGHPGKLLGDG